jgi:hypothetical protein
MPGYEYTYSSEPLYLGENRPSESLPRGRSDEIEPGLGAFGGYQPLKVSVKG